MKKYICMFALAAFTFLSCEKNLSLNDQLGKTVSFTAFTGVDSDNTDTKTTIVNEGGQYKTKWNGGENVNVFKMSTPCTYGKTYEIFSSKAFANQTPGVSTSANFVATAGFWSEDFESTEKYLITYNGTTSVGAYSASESTALNFAYIYLNVPKTQTYTPENEFKIANDILPLYGGVYCDGNSDKDAVSMKNAAIILYLTLRNNMESAVTIKKIVLSSTTSEGRDGIVGGMICNYSPAGKITVQKGYGMFGGDGTSTLTLNCPSGKRPTIAVGETETFGFVIGQAQPKVLTWTAYDESDNAIGTIASIDLTEKTLAPGNYYTITRAITPGP